MLPWITATGLIYVVSGIGRHPPLSFKQLYDLTLNIYCLIFLIAKRKRRIEARLKTKSWDVKIPLNSGLSAVFRLPKSPQLRASTLGSLFKGIIMSNEKSLPDGIVELIARHGLEGYGLYMYILNLGDSFIIDDEFLKNVVMIDREEIFNVISTCLELDILMLGEL